MERWRGSDMVKKKEPPLIKMFFGLFSKQKRTKTIIGLIITVAVVWAVYAYLLQGTAIGDIAAKIAHPTMMWSTEPHAWPQDRPDPHEFGSKANPVTI